MIKSLALGLLVLAPSIIHAKEPQKQPGGIPVFRVEVDKSGGLQSL